MDLNELKIMASTCTLCDLYRGRDKAVFDKGNSNSNIMICGMVPADEENKVGLPFVGRAGKLLDSIIEDAGLTLNDVYITNLVKCYLKAGLSLQRGWIDACLPYLIVQVGIIRPKVIITLGKDASTALLGIESKVSLGKIIKQKSYNYGEGIKVYPTYHPSYLLRGGGKNHKNYEDVVNIFAEASYV
jgi:uracil-DNA glycosylase family 4